MLNCLIVGIGGFIGAVCRYLMSLIPFLNQNSIPWATLSINFIGSFFIGVIAALAIKYNAGGSYWLLLLKVGVCGGFTTFSTFSLETFNLINSGNYFGAFSYILLSVFICLTAVWSGDALVRMV